MSVVSGQSEGTVEVTPSGIPVYYQSKPKRLYRIGPIVPDISDDEFAQEEAQYLYSDESLLTEARAENTSWREIPSVTTVLGVLDKPALPYWGNKIGADGVLELVRRGKLVWVD